MIIPTESGVRFELDVTMDASALASARLASFEGETALDIAEWRVQLPPVEPARIAAWAEAHRAELLARDLASAPRPDEIAPILLRKALLHNPALATAADFIAAAIAREHGRTFDQQLADLPAFGLAEPSVRELARPAFECDEAERDDERVETGATKLGGVPDLAADEQWPVDEHGEPLVFLGQIDLASVGGVLAPLPARGLARVFARRRSAEDRDSGVFTAPAQVLVTTASASALRRAPSPRHAEPATVLACKQRTSVFPQRPWGREQAGRVADFLAYVTEEQADVSLGGRPWHDIVDELERAGLALDSSWPLVQRYVQHGFFESEYLALWTTRSGELFTISCFDETILEDDPIY